MTNLLVDTDVVIDHIRRSVELRARGDRLYYSVITRAELYAGGQERAVDRVLEAATELAVDRVIAERAGRLLRNLAMSFQDAVIAATAQEHRLTLFTRNIKDFERVPKLRLRSAIP